MKNIFKILILFATLLFSSCAIYTEEPKAVYRTVEVPVYRQYTYYYTQPYARIQRSRPIIIERPPVVVHDHRSNPGTGRGRK